MGLNYIDLFDRAAQNAPDRLALIDDQGHEYTFDAMRRLSNQVARQLVDDGFQPQTRFSVLSPNSSEALLSLHAGQRAGGAWCNVNLRSPVETNIDILNRGNCELLFFHSSVREQIAAFEAGIEGLRRVICVDQDIDGYASLASYGDGADDAPLNVHLAHGEIGFQGSTGGTTGAPKLTQSGEEFMSMNMLNFMTLLKFEEPPVNLAVAPITHAAGIFAMAALVMGGTVVLMGHPDQDKLLENIEKYRVSLLFLPPTLIYMLLNHPKVQDTDFSSLEYLIAAAAPFAVEKIAQAVKTFGPVVCNAYGQTECGIVTYLSPAEVVEALNSNEHYHRLKSVGRMCPIVSDMAIINDDGDLLAPGETGEIVMKGPSAMLRYKDDPEATASVQTNGWHLTGDIGYIDKDGYVYVSDRKRDLIISGGFNVFPLEIEQVLAELPAVQDSAVIGVPDEKWGEAVKAVIELAPGQAITEQEVIAKCKASLGSVRAPKSVDFIDELPRSPVGKVLKRELRKQYWNTRETQI